MKYRRVIIDRVVVEEVTKEEREYLKAHGYSYVGDNVVGEMVFEKHQMGEKNLISEKIQ